MSHEKDGALQRFNCDGDGCHRNHEGAPGWDFGQTWRSARDEGWVNANTVRSGWQHFCPDCKSKLGD